MGKRKYKRDSSPSSASSASDVSSRSSGDESMDEASDLDNEVTRARSLPRIPKKAEYVNAVEEVPAPPKPLEVSRRVRVGMCEDTKARFEANAKGRYLSYTDRSTLLAELPLVSSLLALPPEVDEALAPLIDKKKKQERVSISEYDIRELQELFLNSLNLVELLIKLGADGQGEPLPQSSMGYFAILSDLLSAGMRESIVWHRELVLKQLGVSPSAAMPSYRRLPLEGTYFHNTFSSELSAELFGKTLREELSAGDNSIRKSVEKLRNPKGSRSAGASKAKKPKKETHKGYHNHGRSSSSRGQSGKKDNGSHKKKK